MSAASLSTNISVPLEQTNLQNLPQSNIGNLDNTFIGRSVEEIRLNRDLAEYLESQASAYRNYGCVAIAALVAAAGAALFVTGFFAPVYVPITMMSILCLNEPAKQFITNPLFDMSLQFKKQAKRTRDIGRAYLDLPNTLPFIRLDHILFKIPEGQYVRYKPIIAAFNYWQREQEVHETEMEHLIQQARQLTNLDEAAECYLDAQKERNSVLEAKVKKAFLLAVTRNPHFAGDEQDLYALRDSTTPVDRNVNMINTPYNVYGWAMNAIFQDFGDKRASHFLVFNDPEIHPISLKEGVRMNEHAIADRIEHAMWARENLQ